MTLQSRRLWRAERAGDVDDPALSARPDRARLGLSHRERPAPPWLAAGEMEMKVGAPFELIWRNDEPTTRPASGPRLRRRAPDGEPDHRLTRPAGWPSPGERVAARLVGTRPKGEEGAAHRDPSPPARPRNDAWRRRRLARASRRAGRAPDRREPAPFWDGWTRLKTEYDRRIRTDATGVSISRRTPCTVDRIA